LHTPITKNVSITTSSHSYGFVFSPGRVKTRLLRLSDSFEINETALASGQRMTSDRACPTSVGGPRDIGSEGRRARDLRREGHRRGIESNAATIDGGPRDIGSEGRRARDLRREGHRRGIESNAATIDDGPRDIGSEGRRARDLRREGHRRGIESNAATIDDGPRDIGSEGSSDSPTIVCASAEAPALPRERTPSTGG
jgi:hypothetical protein